METTVEPLEDNKVRVHVVVPADEFETAITAAFRKLAREVKIPGFRPGKAPRTILEQRFGVAVGREQALKDAVPQYYVDAVTAEDLDVIAMPDIKIVSGEDEGDVVFDAVVEVRPEITLSGYEGVTVEVPSVTADDEQIENQLASLRERFSALEAADGPIADEHFVSIDIVGEIDGAPEPGLTADDFMYRVGSATIVPELDEALRGADVGAELSFDAEIPGGGPDSVASFRVAVKELQRRVLPELTDTWVEENTEHGTIEELRADVTRRIEMVARMQAQMALREQAMVALSELVTVPIPDALVNQEVEQRLHDLVHRLEAQGASIPQYLAAIGKDQQEFVDEVRTGAQAAVASDLALRSIVNQEAISAEEAEVAVEIERLAERMGDKPDQVRKALVKQGRMEALRSDIARGKALEFVIERATVVDPDGKPVDLNIAEAGLTGTDESSPEPEED
jgi:trigger factor